MFFQLETHETFYASTLQPIHGAANQHRHIPPTPETKTKNTLQPIPFLLEKIFKQIQMYHV